MTEQNILCTVKEAVGRTLDKEALGESKTPYSEAERLLSEALGQDRILIPEDFSRDTTELVVVVPVFAEWDNGNFNQLLESFANQDDDGAVLVIALNSTTNADDTYRQENQSVRKMIEFIQGKRFSIPNEAAFNSTQLAQAHKLKAILSSRLVLLNMDGQLQNRDLAAVRTAGTILASTLAKSSETPVAWLDCDTQVTAGYTRLVKSYYEANQCDSLFLQLLYEPSGADELLANTTVDYQCSIAKSYLQMYWRKLIGRGDSIGLGGPVITARAKAFSTALEKLRYLELDGKGGGEDYSVTQKLNKLFDCHFSDDISVRTSDRRRPDNVGYDSADRAKGLHAGAVAQELRWPSLSSMVRTDVLSSAIESLPIRIGSTEIHAIRSLLDLLHLDSHHMCAQLAEVITTDEEAIWGDFDTGTRLSALLTQDQKGADNIFLEENQKKQLIKDLIKILLTQKGAMAESVLDYAGDLGDLFSGLLGSDDGFNRFEEFIIDEEIRISHEVGSRIAQLKELYSNHKQGISITGATILAQYPFLNDYLERSDNLHDFLERVALTVPDMFSLGDDTAREKRSALATVRAATKMLAEVLSTLDYLDTYTPLQVCRWNVEKGLTTQEEFATIASMLNISVELADLRVARKFERNGLDEIRAFTADGRHIGTFKAFNDRIEIVDLGMITEATESCQQRVNGWSQFGIEGVTLQILSKTDSERKLVLRWQTFLTDKVVKSII